MLSDDESTIVNNTAGYGERAREGHSFSKMTPKRPPWEGKIQAETSMK